MMDMGSEGLGLAERRSRIRAAAESLAGFAGVLAEASGEDAGRADGRGRCDGGVGRGGSGGGGGGGGAAGGGGRAGMNAQRGCGRSSRRRCGRAAPGRSRGWPRRWRAAPGGRGAWRRDAAAAEPRPGLAAGGWWGRGEGARVSPGLALAAWVEGGPVGAEAGPGRGRGTLVVHRGCWTWARCGAGPQMREAAPGAARKYGVQGEPTTCRPGWRVGRGLSQPWVESGDMTEYQLVMTPEQAAVLEAAIGRSAPGARTRNRGAGTAPGRAAPGGRRWPRCAAAPAGLDADGRGAEVPGRAGRRCT